jgi:RNA polymerase sigma-70 factor (ECF subfamily)
LSEYNESKLIRQAREGNEEAFRQLVTSHEQRIRATAYGMLGDIQQAEDIAQEVFIQFFKNLNRFRGEAALSTYLTRIAINLSLNELERIKRRRMRFQDIKEENGLPEEPGPDKARELEVREILEQGLRRLEPEFRVVLALRLIEGYSLKETAQILQLPVGTVASRLSRAQEKLKNLIGPFI